LVELVFVAAFADMVFPSTGGIWVCRSIVVVLSV